MRKIIFYVILLLLITMIIPNQPVNQANTGVDYDISDEMLDNFDSSNMEDNTLEANIDEITTYDTSVYYMIGSQFLNLIDTDSNGKPDLLEVGIQVSVQNNADLWLEITAYINNSGSTYYIESESGFFYFEETGIYSISIYFDTGEFYVQEYGITDLSFNYWGDACDSSGCGMWIENDAFTFYDIDTNNFDGLPAYIIYDTMVISFLDDDSNGLYDWLEVSINVNITRETDIDLHSYGWDVATSDYYIDTTYAYYNNLAPGIHTLNVLIEGYKVNILNIATTFNLYISGYCDNPYYEINSVYLNSESIEAYLDSSLFEGPPVTLDENSLIITYVDDDTNGLYDYIEIVFLLDSTSNNVEIGVWIDVAYEDAVDSNYFMYEYFNEELVIGINTITVQIDGAAIWGLQTSGELLFYFYMDVYTDSDSYRLPVMAPIVSFNSFDFDPPAVVLDPNAVVSWTSDDLDNNGLIDNLVIYVPIIINEDGSVYYQMRLYDADGNSLGYYGSTHDTTDGSDLIGIFSSGNINDRAVSGEFYIEVNIYTSDTSIFLESETYLVDDFDPADFDTYAITLAANPNIRYLEIDTDNDGSYDWLNVTIDVYVRIPGKYRFITEFDCDYSNILSSVTLNMQNTGITSIDFGINGWFIANNPIDTLILDYIGIYSFATENSFSYNVEETIYDIPYEDFEITIDAVSSSLNVGDSMTYEDILSEPFKIVVDIISISNGYVEATLTFDDDDDGNDWSFYEDDRYMENNQRYFPWQINPEDVEIGTWFGGWLYEEMPIQILGTTTIELNGEVYSAYLAYDGLVIYFYEMKTGVLLIMDMSFSGMVLVLTDSTFTFDIVDTGGVTDDVTSTQEEDTPVLELPAFDIFTLLLAFVVPVIVIRKKKKINLST